MAYHLELHGEIWSSIFLEAITLDIMGFILFMLLNEGLDSK